MEAPTVGNRGKPFYGSKYDGYDSYLKLDRKTTSPPQHLEHDSTAFATFIFVRHKAFTFKHITFFGWRVRRVLPL